MNFKKPGKIVKVTWEDAYVQGGWQRDPLGHEPILVDSVGHVMLHDKKGIMLAMGRSNEDGAMEKHFIPAGMIRKIKVYE